MKKEILIITIFLISICKIPFGQINALHKSHGQYVYHNTFFDVYNNFILEQGMKLSPELIHFSFKIEHLLITGSELKISITELDNRDSINGPYSVSFYIRDTAATDSNLFKLKNMQLSVKENNKIIDDWNDVLNYPSFLASSIALKDNRDHFKISYHVFNDSLNVNDSIEIEFRSKNNLQPLSTYFLKRIESPIAPFLAMMLKSNDKDFVPLESEIQMIKSYLNLEQLRFGFKYEINVDNNINTGEIQIPSLLIQPLIEKAVKQGISGMRENGKRARDGVRKEKRGTFK